MEMELSIDAHVACMVIKKPDRLNVLTPELMCEFQRHCEHFLAASELRVAIITGEGPKAFCAGADIKSWLPFVAETRKHPEAMPRTPLRGMTMTKPTIAAVNGYALGGGAELALACDIRIASTNAVFGWPEASLGILPRLGGTQRLPRIVGRAKALEILLTGKRLTAREALEIGLVTEVVEPEELMPTAREYALRVCALAPLAVRSIKRCIDEGCEMELTDGMALENELGFELYDTADYVEGRRAFAEKRPPVFVGA